MKGRVFIPAVTLIFCIGVASSPGWADDGGKKKDLRRIKQEMQEKKRKIRKADRKERSVLADLERIDKAVQSADSELADQHKRLREAEGAFKNIERDAAETRQNLDGIKKIYRERVRALYKMGRSSYGATILVSDSFSTALKRVKYLGAVAERDRAVMQEYGRTLDQLTLRQAELAERKQEVARRKQSTRAKQAELEIQRQKKAALLASVRKEKGLYEQTLKELEESSASLWAMIKKAEQEKKAATEKKATQEKKVVQALPSGAGETSTAAAPERGRLPWPVNGQILTRFGMQRHPQFGTVVFRRGIEIEARQGDVVRAVSDGSVAYADWYKGYGKLMILEHGSGLYSLYGHLSEFALGKGDRVLQGQVIGLAGDTGSLRGAKLYFEIRNNGEAQDPLKWLAKK